MLFNSACVAASVALMWFAPMVPLPALLRGVGWLTSVVLVPLALPQMTDGCDPEWVEPGDRLRVLYDPKGASGPLEDEDTEVDLDPGSYRGTLGGLAALTVAAGTWGCVRLNRRDNE
ncbi:hypothetical protein WKI65_42565 [Streptomyces sp. MS1.AVA.3]|uniref:hypothetical protein n=1 Tax=Streptomyces decoyicus TaxID=249567 RepID=UPI0030C0F09B